MANGINKVFVLGNMGSDPEIKYMPSGKAVVNINVAVNEVYTSNEGERKESVEWFYVSVFGRAAEFVAEATEKGSQVWIEGRLQTRKWEDAGGVQRQMTGVIARQVIVLRGKKREDNPELHHDIDPDDVPF